jgi:hypothetical protein
MSLSEIRSAEYGSTEHGAASAKRCREISEWMVRTLEVNKAESHCRGEAWCHADSPMLRISIA